MLEQIMIAFPCAVVAYIYTELQESGKILDWWGEWLISKHADAANGGKKFKERIYYLLMCPLCMAGQFALWTYLTMHILTFNIYDLPNLVFTVSLSILIAKIFQRWS